MSDRPIICSGPMVRALLDDRKTQTRRVLKRRGYDLASCPRATLCDGELIQFQHPRGGPYTCVRTPYAPGDRLWVREAFALGFDLDDHDMPIGDEPKLFFAATYDGRRWLDRDTDEWRDEPRWTPSIHMPRWASRITLAVTAVRVQRLQEISREDAIAEGCESPLIGSEAPRPGPGVYLADERTSFAQLWNRLKGPGSWDANPWVVAVSFVTHMRNIDHE